MVEVEHLSATEWCRPGKAAEFKDMLESHRGEKMLILLNGYPDPDSIASAMAHQWLASQYGIECVSMTFQDPSHPENRALVKVLEIPLVRYDGEFDPSPFSSYAFVDSQRGEPAEPIPLEGKTFASFVDHHKSIGEMPAQFVDVREEAGATCTIYADYLRHALPNGLDPEDPEQVRLATAMAHGIRTDTRGLMEATPSDFEALVYLQPAVDRTLHRRISRQAVQPEVMEMIHKALERKAVFENFILSDVGFVRSENRDGIPQTADFLLRRAGTDTVIVFGIVEGKTIDGSMRTTSEVVDPDQFLKKTFGMDEVSGKYYGGGNSRDKGGFQIPLGFLAHHADRDAIYRMAKDIVTDRFLESIGKKDHHTD